MNRENNNSISYNMRIAIAAAAILFHGKMHLGHHATRTSAAICFYCRKIRVNDLIKAF